MNIIHGENNLKSYRNLLQLDAFFPFRDSIDHASTYGVTYITQPGGSMRDKRLLMHVSLDTMLTAIYS